MIKKLVFLATTLMVLASPIFAQTAGDAAASSNNWRKGLAYIAMGIASGLCGLGQAKAVASSAEAMARNPGAQAGIRFALILGLVLIESLALYTLVITFIVQG
jgi:F-type H+-transporting ATPase subunit c